MDAAPRHIVAARCEEEADRFADCLCILGSIRLF